MGNHRQNLDITIIQFKMSIFFNAHLFNLNQIYSIHFFVASKQNL